MTSASVEHSAAECDLGSVSQIPAGEGREFRVLGRLIAVFNTRGRGVYAVDALCPHRDGPIADGLVGGSVVVCPFHARKYDLATGEALDGGCGLRTYPIRVTAEGQMLLSLQVG